MSSVFEHYEAKVEEKLQSMGIQRKTIYDFEEKFVDIYEILDLDDFVECMAKYGAQIWLISESTEYSQERLWTIWSEYVDAFIQGHLTGLDLEGAWTLFKKCANERQW